MNASPEAAPKDPPMNLKSWAPTTTSISLTLPFAIETASSCFVISRADFNLSVYFLLSSNFKGSSFGNGVFITSYSLLSKKVSNLLYKIIYDALHI